MIVLYLSNRFIRVVDGDVTGGKLHAKKLLLTVDNHGSILNGTVTDEESFTQLIQNMWESNQLPKKGVRLVIDSNQFTTKIIEAPALKPKQLMPYISREFTDVERISNPVYGCFDLTDSDGGKKSKNKVLRLFGMVAPRDFIQNYVDLFAKMGIGIESVESALGATLRFSKICRKGKESTYIFQFVDDITLISLLFVDGKYQYSSRNRLFSTPSTPEYAVEIARNVSNILQFAKAQELAQVIPQVYISGLDEETYQVYQSSIGQIDSNMSVEQLDLENYVKYAGSDASYEKLTHFAICMGGLIKTEMKTSILAQMSTSPEVLAAKQKRMKTMVPILALGGVLLALTAVFGVRVLILNHQVKEANDYNNSQQVVEGVKEFDTLSKKVEVMGTLSNSMESLKTTVLGYPLVNSKTEATVQSCANGLVTANISSYDSSSGILSFDTTSKEVDSIHKFITLLSQQKIFSAVDYTGYSQGSDGTWSVEVNCTMAGRQEETDETEKTTDN